MHLYELPLLFALIGLALYTVLAGADFGAGFWQLRSGPRSRAVSVCATTPTTRWRRSGRPTTSG